MLYGEQEPYLPYIQLMAGTTFGVDYAFRRGAISLYRRWTGSVKIVENWNWASAMPMAKRLYWTSQLVHRYTTKQCIKLLVRGEHKLTVGLGGDKKNDLNSSEYVNQRDG